jgi:hypothetical protein
MMERKADANAAAAQSKDELDAHQQMMKKSKSAREEQAVVATAAAMTVKLLSIE